MSARFWISNGLGETVDEPSPERMRSFLAALDPRDEEHGAAWLQTADDEEVTLEWSVDGRLVLDDHGRVRHLPGVSQERVVELWCALVRGDRAAVLAAPWREGNGFVQTEERRAEMERWQRDEDRAFHDALGAERSDVPCRRERCGRGAIAHSVLCRAHHFESVRGRPYPFSD